jgi:polysaccharide biosynthesis transport protein
LRGQLPAPLLPRELETIDMNAAPFPSLTPHELVRLLIAHRKLLIVPALAGAALAAAYSLVMPRYWEASQGLVVRQETAGAKGPSPGKFADLYEMRTLQETILEVAKSRQVIVATLKAVDQRTKGAAAEPDAEEIEKLRERLKMLPPDGGEFGKTEVFYFYVKDPSRQRAEELVGELCNQLDAALRELRIERARSLVVELQQQVDLAQQMNEEQTARLAEVEKAAGSDLGELRMLHTSSSGQSDLRTEVVQLESDMRKFTTQVREAGELLKLLRAAQQDAQQLIATPNSLLVTQPSLRQLKDGLIRAQIETARLEGTRSMEHPQVKAAVESEQQIRDDLHRELVTAIRGAEIEQQLAEQRVAATAARLRNLQARLENLAAQRAEYANRVAALENSRASLNQARHNLSTAKAAEAAAEGSSLVTRIGDPETGPYPVGPGRTVVTAAGGVAGLMLGAGLIFFTAGAPASHPPLVGVRTSTGDNEQLPPRKTQFSKLEPALRRRSGDASPDGSADLEPRLATPASAAPWDVELRQAVDHRTGSTGVNLAAASKQLLSGSRPATAPAETPPSSTHPSAISSGAVFAAEPSEPTEATASKPSLPTPPGSLPSAAGSLPPLVREAAPGLTLQAAIHAQQSGA